MSQPVNVLPIEECLKILQQLKTKGLTAEERDEFVVKALAALTDSDQTEKFTESIRESARLAKEIDVVFTNEIQWLYFLMVAGLWMIYPLYVQWLQLRERWRDCLRFSREVASDTAGILQRFDQVYLAQVENIQTDQDRLKAISAIEPFIDELKNNDKAAELSRRFLDLKRDIAEWASGYTSSVSVSLINEIKALEEMVGFVSSSAQRHCAEFWHESHIADSIRAV